jgi:hypothetical protein
MEPDDGMPRGDEPEYRDWLDDLDFEVLDCVEVEVEYEELIGGRDVFDF